MTYPLAFRAYEYWWTAYKRTWRGTVVTSIVNPVFYLGALGIGLGTLVDRASTTPGGVKYLAFVAPGVLAATAMQIGTQESSWPVLGSIKWTRSYYAMLAAPLRIRDILWGHQLWILTRVVTSSAVYLAIIAAFGGIESAYAVLAVPACLLIGAAFAGPMAAYAATKERDNAFVPIMRFAIVPMFLFSGTFFPVTRLPVVLEWVAYATPLWHGVDLCRSFTLGKIDWGLTAGHVAYLLVWAAAGIAWGLHTYRERLLK